MANRALKTGRHHGWNLNLYEGVNGKHHSLATYGIHYANISKKAHRLLQRPGTVGCFLSHYKLWRKCQDENTPICIFEHDVIFNKPMGEIKTCDIYKFEGFTPAKPIKIGTWYEGARAYIIYPTGASKLIDWINVNGALPADWFMCDGLVNMEFDKNNKVTFKTTESYTENLQ